MFCLLRLELELAVQAKAMLMARKAGLHVPRTSDLRRQSPELTTSSFDRPHGDARARAAQSRPIATSGTAICWSRSEMKTPISRPTVILAPRSDDFCSKVLVVGLTTATVLLGLLALVVSGRRRRRG
jgi:hypothetical protein